MPYGFVVIFGAMFLTLYYVVVTEASLLSKLLVFALFDGCIACIFWWHRYSLVAFFLLVGLGIFITLYRVWVQSHFPDRRD